MSETGSHQDLVLGGGAVGNLLAWRLARSGRRVAIENYPTGLVWDIMRRCPPAVTGLWRAGFTGGWLQRGRRGR